MNSYISFFTIFGVHIQVRCKYKNCLEQIKEHLHSYIDFENNGPEIILDIDLEEIGKYLFRSRPSSEKGPLFGVKYQTLQQKEFTEWTSYKPPLPPFDLYPLKDRFIGIHAASISNNNHSAYLIIGESGSGKSTLSLNIAKKHGFSLMTDELAVIHRRSKVVEPFPRPVGYWTNMDGKLSKHNRPAHEVCSNIEKEPLPIKKILLLKPERNLLEPILYVPSQNESLKFILKQHTDLGSSFDEGIRTINTLVHQLPTMVLSYNGYAELMDMAPYCVDFFLK